MLNRIKLKHKLRCDITTSQMKSNLTGNDQWGIYICFTKGSKTYPYVRKLGNHSHASLNHKIFLQCDSSTRLLTGNMKRKQSATSCENIAADTILRQL